MRQFSIFCSCVIALCVLYVSNAYAVLARSEGPIAIDAQTLEVLQQEGRAIFSGDVIAKQGNMTLQSNRMTVFYNANETGQASGFGAMSRIDAQGSVLLTTPGESAKAGKGVYDAVRNKVFLYGEVVLRRGGNILNGSQLEYDLTSGSSVLSGGVQSGSQPSSTGTGRVRGIFVPDRTGSTQGE